MRRALVIMSAAASLVAGACRLPNPDHCVHKDVDSDAWCAAEEPDRPHCSPCASEHHGCVASRPTSEQCPDYAPDSTSGTSGASTG